MTNYAQEIDAIIAAQRAKYENGPEDNTPHRPNDAQEFLASLHARYEAGGQQRYETAEQSPGGQSSYGGQPSYGGQSSYGGRSSYAGSQQSYEPEGSYEVTEYTGEGMD